MHIGIVEREPAAQVGKGDRGLTPMNQRVAETAKGGHQSRDIATALDTLQRCFGVTQCDVELAAHQVSDELAPIEDGRVGAIAGPLS